MGINSSVLMNNYGSVLKLRSREMQFSIEAFVGDQVQPSAVLAGKSSNEYCTVFREDFIYLGCTGRFNSEHSAPIASAVKSSNS